MKLNKQYNQPFYPYFHYSLSVVWQGIYRYIFSMHGESYVYQSITSLCWACNRLSNMGFYAYWDKLLFHGITNQESLSFIDEKWQVALVKLDPWCELICRQVEKRSASWYSFKYRLVFGGTGSVEGTTCWYLEEMGQY